MAVTRAIGDRWLREARSPLLRVSSVHCIESCNVLINPRHPGLGRVRLMRDESFRFPVRLRRNAGA